MEELVAFFYLLPICPRVTCLTFVNFILLSLKNRRLQFYSSFCRTEKLEVLEQRNFGFAVGMSHGPPRVMSKILHT